MFRVFWDQSATVTPKDKQYKQKTWTKSYKTEIKNLANPELAYSGFEKRGSGQNQTGPTTRKTKRYLNKTLER